MDNDESANMPAVVEEGNAGSEVLTMASSPVKKAQKALINSGGNSAKYAIASNDDTNESKESTKDVKPVQYKQHIYYSKDVNEEEQFHDVQLDEGDGDYSYQLVKKSIYKEKKGFLSRLLDGSSSSKHKYLPTDGVDGTELPTDEAIHQHRSHSQEQPPPIDESEAENAEITIEEEESIQVSIEPSEITSCNKQHEVPVTPLTSTCIDEDDDVLSGGAPQVVIHSGESDSDSMGFAMLNPVINGGLTGRGRKAPAATSAATSTQPFLMEIPVATDLIDCSEHFILIINALGASGLVKVEKFGTQSSFLEMKVCDNSTTTSSSTTMRTGLHKKGGSEAQWNQQFMAPLRSSNEQFLHVAVKTNNKILIGEANVGLNKVGDMLYDQYYTLYRSLLNAGVDGLENPTDDSDIVAGQVHLQLKIVDRAAALATSAVVPSLPLPFPSGAATTNSPQTNTLQPIAIPSVLKTGSLFYKIPYHNHGIGLSVPKRQWVMVIQTASKPSALRITWCNPSTTVNNMKDAHGLDLELVTDIREGNSTKAFESHLQSSNCSSVVKEKDKCFSLISKTRTLDLVASSKEEAQVWVCALRELLFNSATDDSSRSSQHSARTMINYKQSALSARSLSSTGSNVPTKSKLSAWRNEIFNLARRNMIDTVSRCLQDGCPIDLLETGTGDTLLMVACRLGNVQLVELCLVWRAKNDPHPEFGETALQVAVNARHAKCLALLLSTAAKSDMDSEIVNHIDSNNDAPLHVAARHGDLECLQLLLHHGADICVVDEFGRTPLHSAVANGHLDCVAYLLDVGGDSVLNTGDHDGDTPLHYAALSGNETTVKLLLESAANVFFANVNGETPHDIAVREKHPKCVEIIAKYYLTSEEEHPTTSPASRNGMASVLLQRQKRLQSGEDDCETDEHSERHTSQLSPRAIHEPAKTLNYENDYAVFPSLPVATVASISRTAVLSPSAQIREALARNQRKRTESLPPTPRYGDTIHIYDHHYYSPRETQIRPDYLAQTVLTDRIDRDFNCPDPAYSNGCFQASIGDYSHQHQQSHISYDHMDRIQSHYVVTSRPSYEPDAGCSNRFSYSSNHDGGIGRNASTVTLSPRDWAGTPVAPVTNRLIPPPPTSPMPEWDTFFTEEGYPYYVNRYTGVSQWEMPSNIPNNYQYAPPPPLPSLQKESKSDTLSADAIIRARLAETRKQKTSAVTGLTNVQPTPSFASIKDENEIPAGSTVSNKSNRFDVSPVTPSSTPVSDAIETLSTEADEAVKSLGSKYEARTGVKLSIDILSPPAQNETRPVYIPSPRAKSLLKKDITEETGVDAKGSFQKSRESSPRGKSKNIQLIELKRANNLAISLASFKIHGNYEQIVDGVASLNEALISADLLASLQRFFPTEEERQLLQAYDGSLIRLGKAERFLFLMLQVPQMQERIDMFLYKLEFPRLQRSLLSKIQIVKRACRDLVENFAFVQALEEFFSSHRPKSFDTFRTHKRSFMSQYLSQLDLMRQSFHNDIQQAKAIETMDVQMQLNRLTGGIRPIQAFVESTAPSPQTKDKRDLAAHDVLRRFLLETRTQILDIEAEYGIMGTWEDKVLSVFGESKASCQLTTIIQCIVEMLE